MSEEKANFEFFDNLKQIRLSKNISLDYISGQTRIQIDYLVALEGGDLESIPKVYDKLFFKSYLKALNLDEKEYYSKFLHLRDIIRREEVITPPILEESDKPKLNIKNLYVFLPILGVIIIIWFLLSYTHDIGTNEDLPVQEINIQEVAEKMNAKIDSVMTEKNREDSLQQSGLRLNISGIDQTWFRVLVDNADTTEYLLQKDQVVSVEADSTYQLLIGKADGLNLNLNGKDLGQLGEPGQVVRYLKIDSTGIVAKQLAEPKIKSESESENELNEL